MVPAPFFYRESNRVRVTVRTALVGSRAHGERAQFVFAYFVRIENVGEQAVQLLSRRWLIHDAEAGDSEVVGDGVVGQQPTIPPGAVHEYRSSCVLSSPSGYMEGSYFFVRADGSRFAAEIPRFTLEAEA